MLVGCWWGDEVHALQPVLDYQRMPADACRLSIAMLGACLSVVRMRDSLVGTEEDSHSDVDERAPHRDHRQAS